MSQNVPTAAKEHVSVDNIPTGNVELLIRRREMPDKLLVSRYWNGMEKPEQLIYVPERTCRYELKDGWFVCSNCGRSTRAYEGKGDPLSPPNFCPRCGARVEVDE